MCQQHKISDAVSALIVRANQCLRKKDEVQARQLYKKAVEADPGNGYVRLLRAGIFSDTGDFAASIADCDIILAKSPNDIEALNARSSALFESKQYQKAIDDVTRIIKLKPRDSWGYHQRAIAYRKLGLTDQAAKDDLQDRQLRAPGEVRMKVTELVAAGQLGEAKKVLDEALSSDPKNKELLRARAHVFIKAGRYDEACAEITGYMTPADWQSRVDRARAYEGAEKSIEAINDYSEALKLMKPDLSKAIKFENELMRPALATHKKTAAHVVVDQDQMRLLLFVSKYSGVLESRARLYLKAHYAEAAIKDCNELLAQRPNVEINALRADALEMAGKSKEALSEYQVVIKHKAAIDRMLKANSSASMKADYITAALKRLQPTLMHSLIEGARVADKLSDVPTALTYYSELIRMKPSESEFYLSRAKDFEKLKQYDKAQKDLDKLITLEPKDAVAYDLRARVNSEQGKYSEAVNDYTTAIKSAPEDAEFLLGKRSRMYDQMGKKDLANKDLQEIEKIQQTNH